MVLEVLVSKKCSKCEKIRAVNLFGKSNKTKSKLRSECKICRKKDNKYRNYKKEYSSYKKSYIKRASEWNKNNPRRKLLRKYGLTENDYEKLYKNQKGKCKICNRYFKILAVDHCHKTFKIRGLLCKKCNSGIGFLNDDPKLIEKALKYLYETPTKETGRT